MGGPRRSGSPVAQPAAQPGGGSGRGSGSVVADFLAVLETIAVAVQFQDVDVMGQPVKERAGQPFRAEDLGPFMGLTALSVLSARTLLTPRSIAASITFFAPITLV